MGKFGGNVEEDDHKAGKEFAIVQGHDVIVNVSGDGTHIVPQLVVF
jgi:hypothetical protein